MRAGAAATSACTARFASIGLVGAPCGKCPRGQGRWGKSLVSVSGREKSGRGNRVQIRANWKQICAG
jgi:hypothetical protein